MKTTLKGEHIPLFEITVPNTGDYSILYFESSTMGMTSPTLFDEIVIDTISVPEPMSFKPISIGWLLLKNTENLN